MWACMSPAKTVPPAGNVRVFLLRGEETTRTRVAELVIGAPRAYNETHVRSCPAAGYAILLRSLESALHTLLDSRVPNVAANVR